METKKAGRKGESFDLFVAENELIRTLNTFQRFLCAMEKSFSTYYHSRDRPFAIHSIVGVASDSLN